MEGKTKKGPKASEALCQAAQTDAKPESTPAVKAPKARTHLGPAVPGFEGVCILPHLEVRGSRLRAFRQKQASTAQVPPREFAGLTAAEYFRKRSRHCFDFQKTRAPNRGTLSCPQESALGSAWNCSSKAANGNERIGAHLSTVKS